MSYKPRKRKSHSYWSPATPISRKTSPSRSPPYPLSTQSSELSTLSDGDDIEITLNDDQFSNGQLSTGSESDIHESNIDLEEESPKISNEIVMKEYKKFRKFGHKLQRQRTIDCLIPMLGSVPIKRKSIETALDETVTKYIKLTNEANRRDCRKLNDYMKEDFVYQIDDDTSSVIINGAASRSSTPIDLEPIVKERDKLLQEVSSLKQIIQQQKEEAKNRESMCVKCIKEKIREESSSGVALVGKRVKHKFLNEKNGKPELYSGYVISRVPGYKSWYNIKYDGDPIIYSYQLQKDYKDGDLTILDGGD